MNHGIATMQRLRDSRRFGVGAPPHLRIENGVRKSEMRYLDKAILTAVNKQIVIAHGTEWILSREAAQSDDAATGSMRRRDRFQDTRRASRTADGEKKVAGTSVHLELEREDILIAQIVRKGG